MTSNLTPSRKDKRETPTPARGLLARFVASRRGATAVEFALVSIPFITLIFAILELAIVYLVTLTLESATASAARQMRVNSSDLAQGLNNTSATMTVLGFRQLICNNMSWLQTACLASVNNSQTTDAASGGSDGLVIDVRDPSSFTTATMTPAFKNGVLAQFDGTKCFYSGQAGSIVVLRAYYPWLVYTPFLNNMFVKLANGNVVVYDTEVFEIEQDGAVSGAATTC